MLVDPMRAATHTSDEARSGQDAMEFGRPNTASALRQSLQLIHAGMVP